ncbi:MAG: InlB B-repeat-containing protein [Spirochaetales bacterium]|nr:InlB B-repeat-containing protein [Spirochaetales bacterium]
MKRTFIIALLAMLAVFSFVSCNNGIVVDDLFAGGGGDTYTVTLNANGGTVNSGNVTSYTKGVGATLPTDVTKDGYGLVGWYEDSEFSGSAVTEISTTDTGNKTFYAKWTPLYLVFKSTASFNIRTNNNSKNWAGTLEYSTDGSTWNAWGGTTTIYSGSYGGKHVIFLRGTGNTAITTIAEGRWILGGDATSVECKGDIRTLLDYDDPDAPVMAANCFNSMFQGWSRLTTAPELPATTLANSCYKSMFSGCNNLTAAPSLPAESLASDCYYSMFSGCNNLTAAPSLPAVTLVSRCYQFMFNGCSNLNSITCLATDISAYYATYYWAEGVAATGTFTKAESMTDWGAGASGIPDGWTVQNYSN